MNRSERLSPRARRGTARAATGVLWACAALLPALSAPALAAPAPAARLQLAMGPNPGGRLGEDMPFKGDDVIRRAPAATKEREPVKPAGSATPPTAANAPCKEATPKTGKRADCATPPNEDGAAKR